MKVNGIKVVPAVLLSGIAAFIVPGTIPHEKWTPLHGKTLDGETVNSPKIAQVPDTNTFVIEDNGGYFSMSRNDFEVLCAQGAEQLGYKVNPAGGSSRRT